MSGIPRIAVFPKCYMEELCVTRSFSLLQWIEMAARLPLERLELYPNFFASFRESVCFSRSYITRTCVKKSRMRWASDGPKYNFYL
jgi:hypothetical protein